MLDYTTPLNRKKTPALGIGDQQRKPEPETPAPPTLEATTAPAAESPVMQTAKTKTPVEKGGGNPIKSFGKNVWAGMLSGATSFNKMIGLGHSDFTKEMFITPGEKKAQRIREETMSDSFLQNFSNDFALGLGSMASTIPMDVASGGAAKVALAGKLVPKVSALLSSMPDFAVGMGIHGGLEAAQEDPSVSNVLITAGERAAFGTLYGKLGTSLASIPKFAALGAGEAVYDAAKRGEVPSMKDIAESTGHGVSMGVLFYFLPKMAASTKILAEKKAIYQLNSSLNKAVKTKDYKFLKPKLKQFLDNESIRPKVKAAIFEMVKPLQGEKAKGKKAEPKERRADEEYRKRVSEMTMEERETALLRHELTGLKNRRSYEETEGERLPFQASLDVDGLKFINDVVGGHPVGDVLLKRIGGALERAGKEYAEKGKSEQYHISGDEFIIEGSSPQHIEAVVSRAKEILKSEPIEFAELGTGEKVKYTPDFSHGIARDLKTADKFMIENKAERRVKRGEGELITENPQRLALSVENKFQNAAETNLDRFKEWVNQHDKDTINTASDLLMDQGMRLGNENPKAAIKIVSHARWLKNQALQKSPTKTSTQKALENDAHGKAIDEALNSPELGAERAAMETKVRPPEEVVPPPEQPPLSLSLATEAKKIGAEFIGMTEDGVGGFRPQFQDAKTGSSFTVRPNESVAQAQLRSREAFIKSQKKKLTPEEQALVKKYGGEVRPPLPPSTSTGGKLPPPKPPEGGKVKPKKKLESTVVEAAPKKYKDLEPPSPTGEKPKPPGRPPLEKVTPASPPKKTAASDPFGSGGERSHVDVVKERLSRAVEETIYWVADKNRPMEKIQQKLKQVSEEMDLFLRETQRPKIAAAKVRVFHDDIVSPMIKDMAKHNVIIEALEEYSHAKHAPEANNHLRNVNSKRFLESVINKLSKEERKLFQKEVLKGKREFKPEDYRAKLEIAFKRFRDNKKVNNVEKDWRKFAEKPAGMSEVEAKKILKKHKGNQALEDFRISLQAINDARIDLLHDAGLIPSESYAAMKEAYKYYTPLYREGYDSTKAGVGQGLLPGGKILKTRKGSLKKVVDIFANSVANYENAVMRVEKSKSRNILINLINENPNENFWRINDVKKAPRYDSNGNVQLYPDPLNVEKWEMRIMVNGRQKLITVDKNNRDAMLMLKTLKADTPAVGAFLNGLAKVNRWFARINTSWSPEFIASNFVRDLQTAGINIHSTGVKPKHLFRGTKDMIKAVYRIERGKKLKGTTEEAMYLRFKEAGGKIGWIDAHTSIPNLAKKLNAQFQEAAGNRPIRKNMKNWIKIIEDTNTAVENGVRLHTFRLAVEQGMSDLKAAKIASDLTVDFTKKGAAGPIVNSLYLFSNAGIQGSYRIIRGMAKSKTIRHKIVPGIITAGFTNGLYNNMFGGEDTDGISYFDKEDDFIKERNAVFMIPGADGKSQRVMLPWGYNFFWNMGVELSRMTLAIGEEKEYDALSGGARVVRTFVNAFNPLASGTVWQTVMPTIADPFVMIAENKNWHGGDLTPEVDPFSKVATPDSQRYWKSASTPSKWLAKKMNELGGGNEVRKAKIETMDVSPETLDLIMETAGGSMLRFFQDTLSLPKKFIMEEEVKMNKIPFVRRFYGEKSDWADSRIYYENVTQVLTAKDELDTYKGTDYGDKLSKRLTPIKSLIPYAQDVEYTLRGLRKEKRWHMAREHKAEVERINSKIKTTYLRFNKKFNQKMGK